MRCLNLGSRSPWRYQHICKCKHVLLIGKIGRSVFLIIKGHDTFDKLNNTFTFLRRLQWHSRWNTRTVSVWWTYNNYHKYLKWRKKNEKADVINTDQNQHWTADHDDADPKEDVQSIWSRCRKDKWTDDGYLVKNKIHQIILPQACFHVNYSCLLVSIENNLLTITKRDVNPPTVRLRIRFWKKTTFASHMQPEFLLLSKFNVV